MIASLSDLDWDKKIEDTLKKIFISATVPKRPTGTILNWSTPSSLLSNSTQSGRTHVMTCLGLDETSSRGHRALLE